MTILDAVFVCLIAIGALANVNQIGKPRETLSSGVVILNILFSAGLIYALLT